MNRLGFAATCVFWVAAMSWLLFTKIYPVLDPTPPPAPGFTQRDSAFEQHACWDIQCQGASVGFASNRIRGEGDGRVYVHSTVRLERLRVGELVGELIDSWSRLGRWASPIPDEMTMSLSTETRMTFTEGSLDGFRSSVEVDNLGPMFHLQGQRQGEALHVEVLPGASLSPDQPPKPLVSTQFPIPSETLIVDAFAPYSELSHLRVGKRWQMRSYRAFPPSNPIRIVNAEVIGTEVMVWDGEIITCYVVSFRDAERSGPTAASTALGRMWVNDEGAVLKQNVQIGGVDVEFVRRPEAACKHLQPQEEQSSDSV